MMHDGPDGVPTKDRLEFFREARNDPYLHAVTYHTASAWAMGYEQALRDNDQQEQLASESHSDRVERGLAWLVNARRDAQMAALIAFAELGKIVGRL